MYEALAEHNLGVTLANSAILRRMWITGETQLIQGYSQMVFVNTSLDKILFWNI